MELVPERRYLGTPQELLAVMDRKTIRAMVNLTGGYEQGLAEPRFPRAFLYFYRAFVLTIHGARLSEA